MNTSSFLPCLNFYRFRKLAGDAFLVTVDSGKWQILSGKQFDNLTEGNLRSSHFRQTLETNHIWLTEKNYINYQQEIAARWEGIFQPPSLHIVVVTPQCNLRCLYCHAGLDQNKHECMTAKTASAVLDKILATPANTMTLEIQGGEPMLNFEVCKYLIEDGKSRALQTSKQLSFCIVTNFTNLLTDDRIRFLIDHEVSVSTSIDGDAAIHEHNRNQNYPGGFAILSERVATFRKIWRQMRDDEPQLSAMVTTTSASLTKAHEIVDAYLSLGFDNLFVRPVSPLGRGKCGLPDLSYTPEQFISFWSELNNYIMELWQKGTRIYESHLNLLLKKIFSYDNGYMDLRFPCGASFGQRAYNFDGSIFTCDEGRMLQSDKFLLGTVAETAEAINNSLNGISTMTSSLAELSYCEFCAYKPFCGICPIINWSESGNMLTSIYDSKRCKIYQGMLDYVFNKFFHDEQSRSIFFEMLLHEIERE